MEKKAGLQSINLEASVFGRRKSLPRIMSALPSVLGHEIIHVGIITDLFMFDRKYTR